MKSRELNHRLLAALPELKAAFHEATSWDEGDRTGSHVVFGAVLNPAIEQALEKHDMASMSRFSNFIEVLLNLHDEYAENVIAVSVIERFLDGTPNESRLFRAALGPLGAKEYDAMRQWDIDNREIVDKLKEEFRAERKDRWNELQQRLAK